LVGWVEMTRLFDIGFVLLPSNTARDNLVHFFPFCGAGAGAGAGSDNLVADVYGRDVPSVVDYCRHLTSHRHVSEFHSQGFGCPQGVTANNGLALGYIHFGCGAGGNMRGCCLSLTNPTGVAVMAACHCHVETRTMIRLAMMPWSPILLSPS
jgi:hypothetical protein